MNEVVRLMPIVDTNAKMFSSIFHRRNSLGTADDDATTHTAISIKSDDTPRSILRRQGSERNTLRNVSWSSTYETLEHDSFEQYEGLEGADSGWTYGDTAYTGTYDSRATFETREDATLFDMRDDGTFVTREASQSVNNTGTASTNDSLDSVEAYETGHVKSNEEPAHDTATIMSEEGVEQTVAERGSDNVGDNNENLDLRNIACAASNVTEASELLTDKYGLNEKDAKKGLHILAAESCVSEGEPLFGDKYHGLQDESVGEDVNSKHTAPTPQVPTATVAAQAPDLAEMDAPLTVEIDVSATEEQNPLSPISADDINVFVPGEAEPVEDELILHALSADSFTVGSLSEEQLSESFDENANNASLKANSDEGSLASLKKKDHGYEGIFHKQSNADKSLGHIGLILPFLNRLQCGVFTEDTFMLDVVGSREWVENASTEEPEPDEDGVLEEVSGDVPDDEFEVVDGSAAASDEGQDDFEDQAEEQDAPGAEDDVVEYQIGDYGNVKVRINGEEVSMSDSIDASSRDEQTSSSSKQTSQTPEQTEDDESPRTGGVISFHVEEDNSIPSNESDDCHKTHQHKTKKGFKPLASLRNRISRAASSIVSKGSKCKKKQNKSIPMTALYEGDTLHDRVYHNNVSVAQSRISTELILGDLKIVENTAKIMYQDRFNSTSALLNTKAEDASVAKSKRPDLNVDMNSQRSKATVESSLSPMFRDYFASGI
jgi:hypothetical protein